MKAERISKELLLQIYRMPLDILIEKHELHNWRCESHVPYIFEIDNRKILLETYIEPDEIELKTSFISPDGEFMVVMFYHINHEENYVAIAR